MANPFFSGRIPTELYNQIEKHMKETGERKTEVLIHALSAYVKYELPITPTAAQADAIATLQEQVAAMESGLEERIREAVEQFIQNLPQQKQLELLDSDDNKDIDADNNISKDLKEAEPETPDNESDEKEPSELDSDNDNSDNIAPKDTPKGENQPAVQAAKVLPKGVKKTGLSTGEVSTIVGIHSNTLRDRKRKGKLPVRKNGYLIEISGEVGNRTYWKVTSIFDNK